MRHPLTWTAPHAEQRVLPERPEIGKGGLSAGGVLPPSLFDASDWTDYSKGVARRDGSYYASRKNQEH